MAAVPKAARATSLSGADIPLDTAGTASAIAPAHQARRPRLGRASAVTFAANTMPRIHWMPAARDRSAKLECDRVEHLGHQWIHGLMQIGHEADRSVHQEHLGHLKVIAKGIAVGHRRHGGNRRTGQHEPQAECEEKRKRCPAASADSCAEARPASGGRG